jgi:hypothetical protein
MIKKQKRVAVDKYERGHIVNYLKSIGIRLLFAQAIASS